MAHIAGADPHSECLHLPRTAVRFPVEWRAPEGFIPGDPDTWPRLDGRLEYVNERIRYMPPCGGVQQDVASDVTALLVLWARSHPEFVVASNEAGMMLGDDVRGADAAVWPRSAGRPTGFRRTPPILAVEIAGQDETEEALREKALWYLGAGVEIVWLVLPEPRDVVVLTRGAESRNGSGQTLPACDRLPGLEPEVAAFFRQLDAG
jgi:Uma2 family endonuclease